MNNKIYEVKAPGKAILSGEHSVVYGEDAIAMAIGLYCIGNLYISKKTQKQSKIIIRLDIQQHNIEISTEFLKQIDNIVESKQTSKAYEHFMQNVSQKYQVLSQHQQSIHYKFNLFSKMFQFSWQQHLNQSNFDYFLQISSQIPVGKCLGSSAAFNTVLATLLMIISKKIDVNQINNDFRKIVNEISVVFQSVEHGTPSGIDNFVSAYGGIILFNKNKEPKFKILDHFSNHFKNKFDVAIADSLVQKNTKAAVEMVRHRCQNSEQDRNRIKEIGKITQSILQIFEREEINCQELFQLIKRNHSILKQLNLSHPEIEKLIELGSQNGWVGKITGSGMGGCILLLSTPQKCVLNQKFKIAHLDKHGLIVNKFGAFQ